MTKPRWQSFAKAAARSSERQTAFALCGRCRLTETIGRGTDRGHVVEARRLKTLARGFGIGGTFGGEDRARRDVGDTLEAAARRDTGIDQDIIVAAAQRVEADDHVACGHDLDALDRAVSWRDQMQRRRRFLVMMSRNDAVPSISSARPSAAGSLEMARMAASPDASPISTTRECSASARASLIAVWVVFMPGSAPNTAVRRP